jgi:hypothetical protein
MNLFVAIIGFFIFYQIGTLRGYSKALKYVNKELGDVLKR